MSEPNKYFRLLNRGEVINEGDVFVSADEPSSRLLPNRKSIGYEHRALNDVLRPVQVDEWIEYAKQKPTEADGDNGMKWVQWWSTLGGTHSRYDCPPVEVTHWRRITPPQPIVKRVKVREDPATRREPESRLRHDLGQGLRRNRAATRGGDGQVNE